MHPNLKPKDHSFTDVTSNLFSGQKMKIAGIKLKIDEPPSINYYTTLKPGTR